MGYNCTLAKSFFSTHKEVFSCFGHISPRSFTAKRNMASAREWQTATDVRFWPAAELREESA